MLQLLPALVGMKRSPDLTLTGLQVALTHWDAQGERAKPEQFQYICEKEVNNIVQGI